MENKRKELVELFGSVLDKANEFGVINEFIPFIRVFSTMCMDEVPDINKTSALIGAFEDGILLDILNGEYKNESEVVS